MTLQEALKSGRPLKRTCWTAWRTMEEDGKFYIEGGSDLGRNPVKLEILATDWEVQEPSITITATQFWNAVADSLKSNATSCALVAAPDLARRLGLEPK